MLDVIAVPAMAKRPLNLWVLGRNVELRTIRRNGNCKVAEAVLQEQNPLITASKGVSPEPLSIFTTMQSYYSILNMGGFGWYRIAISPAITGHNKDAGSCKAPRDFFLL